MCPTLTKMGGIDKPLARLTKKIHSLQNKARTASQSLWALRDEEAL